MDFIERVTEHSIKYLEQALVLTPTDEEFIQWVDAQPSSIRPLLLHRGPASCWAGAFPGYLDYLLTVRGYSLHQYMAKQLSEADYLRWVDFIDTDTM